MSDFNGVEPKPTLLTPSTPFSNYPPFPQPLESSNHPYKPPSFVSFGENIINHVKKCVI